MVFSKMVLVAAWWEFSFAAIAAAGNDDCAGSPDVEMPTGARALLQQSGNALPAKVELHPAAGLGEKEVKLHSAAGKCLNFLHIPKNAGASMEETRRQRQRDLTQGFDQTKIPKAQLDEFAAGKISLPWIDADHSGWGWGQSILDANLNCADGDETTCRLHDQTGNAGQCPKFHVPPAYDSMIAAGYEGCDTFCIARHPLAKAVSQHIFVGGECDAAKFAEKVKQVSTELQSNPFKEDCHWVPQTMYTKHCQRILRFEHLAEDFNALMQEYGHDLNLLKDDHGIAHCDLGKHPELIPPETLEWIERYYASDFAEFGYTIGSVA